MFRILLLSILPLLCLSPNSYSELDSFAVCQSYIPSIPRPQCRALVDLYNATNGDEWVDKSGWGSANIGEWHGITVSDIGNGYQVKSVQLAGNGLSGEIPSSIANLGGLNNLDLSNNKLRGELPEGLYQLSQLWTLVLHSNSLSGKVSGQIGNLGLLYFFSIGANNFGGELPEQLFNLPSLIAMSGSENNFSGSIPANISLPKIETINLWNNKLTGDIPQELFEQRTLQTLGLSSNGLSGSIPVNVSNAEALKDLSVENNYLSGNIPKALGSLESLYRLNLSHNRLSGEVPVELGTAKNLVEVRFSSNALEGQLPESLSNLKRLERLYLDKNRLTGTIPYSWSHLSELQVLNVSNNYLNGLFPDSLSALPKLELLDISRNYFSGKFPDSLITSTVINTISISNNYFFNDFEGSRPSIGPSIINDTQYSNGMINHSTVNYSVIVENGNNRGGYISLPKAANHGGVVYAVPRHGYKLASITGCGGEFQSRAYVLPTFSESCKVSIVFESCDVTDESCLVDAGKINGVEKAVIENPSSSRVMSGVVQLRGWYYDEESLDFLGYDYLSSRERELTLVIDGKYRFELSTYLDRSDVVSAMKLNLNDTASFLNNVGWDALLNSGALSNGPHYAQLYSSTNEMLAYSEFNIFNPVGKNKQYQYVRGSFSETWVDDFPFSGSRVKLSFNQAEQNFSMIDQEIGGESTRSIEKYYEEDGLKPEPIQFNSSIPKIKFENPASNQLLSGVVSIRGWDVDAIPVNVGKSNVNHFIRFDGAKQTPLKADDRFDIHSQIDSVFFKSVGRSTLVYAGGLENGMHRLRYWGRHPLKLLAQVEFEAFTPLDQNRARTYIQDVKKTIRYPNFPFEGSEVELSFDQAAQAFVISKQWINGSRVN